MKVGIVGHGSIGSRHAANVRALGHEVLVYDPIVAPSDRVRFERNIYELCDAVIIASPTRFHRQGIRACVERGKHMLVEKPIAFAADSLENLLGSADDKGIVVMMGNNLRFHPCVINAKNLIENGGIGKPIWAHFICAARSLHSGYLSDGAILNTGSHEVDMAMHLLGPARVVYANVIQNMRPGTADSDVNAMLIHCDDIADFMLVHDNGCRSTFHLDFVTPNEIREAWIVGDKDKLGMELRSRNSQIGSRATCHGGSFDQDYKDEIKAFFDRIEGKGGIPGATGWDGLATLETLLYVRKKAGLK